MYNLVLRIFTETKCQNVQNGKWKNIFTKISEFLFVNINQA